MVVKRKSDALYHHGIKGQSWGDQNGPPYPLDSQVSSAVKKKKSKSFIQKLKDKKKGKKLQAARKKKAAERQEKEDIINSGDEKKVKKIAKSLTDEELARAINRINLNRTLNSVDYSNIQKKLDTITKAAQTIGSIGEAAGKVVNVADKVVDIKGKLSGKSSTEKQIQLTKDEAEIAKNILAKVTSDTQVKGIQKDNGEAYLKKLWNIQEDKEKSK